MRPDSPVRVPEAGNLQPQGARVLHLSVNCSLNEYPSLEIRNYLS
jgi:hypothetical protein